MLNRSSQSKNRKEKNPKSGQEVAKKILNPISKLL